MEWLSNLIGYSGQWGPLKIIFPAVMVVSGLWIYVDAQTRVGNGCFWGALAFAVPPIGVPLYYIGLLVMNVRNTDPAFRGNRLERQQQEQERKRRVGMGDIERLREERERDEHGGTMFDPVSGISVSRTGFAHFSDAHAEELIEQHSYEQAWEYLSDLYRLARAEGDGRAQDTYRHYISQLPDGLRRLRELRD